MAKRYLMRQNYWSITDRFTISTDSGMAAFFVTSNFKVIRKKFSLRDLAGNEIFFLQQRAASTRPQFDIFPNEASVKDKSAKLGMVRRKGFFRAKFVAKTNFGEYVAKGKFGMSYTFTITKSGTPVANISKKIINITDTYAVDVLDEKETAVVLAFALAIDEIHHGANKKNKSSSNTFSSIASAGSKILKK